MHWYSLVKLAALDADLLRSFGIPEQNVPSILYFLPTNLKDAGKYLADLRKNPTMTPEELSQIKVKQPKQYVPSIEAQAMISTYTYWPVLKRWIIKQLSKDNERDLELLRQNLGHIRDWSSKAEIRPQLDSYDLRSAIIKANEWTQEQIRLAKAEYEPTKPENVDMTFPNGFTIQRITSAIDTKVEGKKMNHCVGGYCKDVEDEDILVYSLRDKSNTPRVTIGVNNDGLSIFQLKGHTDANPEKYKSYIQKWLATKPEIEYFDNEPFANDYGLIDLQKADIDNDPKLQEIINRKITNTGSPPDFGYNWARTSVDNGQMPKSWEPKIIEFFDKHGYVQDFARKWSENIFESGRAPEKWIQKVKDFLQIHKYLPCGIPYEWWKKNYPEWHWK